MGAFIPVFHGWPLVNIFTVPIEIVLISALGLSGFGSGTHLAFRTKRQHGLITAVLTPVVGGLLAFSLLSYLFPPPLSDWRLIRRFERNEAVFNELRDAVRGEGGLEAISPERIEPADFEAVGVSPDQLRAYQAQMKRLKLLWVNESSSEPENVYFNVDGTRSFIEEDYLYRDNPPTTGTIVEKIREDDVEDFGTVYRHIKDGWYLYAQKISD